MASNPNPQGNPLMEATCTHLMRKLLENNDRLLPPDATSPPQPVTRFDARSVPAIGVEAYLSRILKYAPCETDVLVLVLIHLERLSKMRKIFVNSWNVHRLLITSYMIAAKYSSDTFFTNTHYAKVGGLPTMELNKLEMEFLSILEFDLSTSPAELQRTYELLLSHVQSSPTLLAVSDMAAIELPRLRHRQAHYAAQAVAVSMALARAEQEAEAKAKAEAEREAEAAAAKMVPPTPDSLIACSAQSPDFVENAMNSAKCSAVPTPNTLPTPPSSPDSPTMIPESAANEKIERNANTNSSASYMLRNRIVQGIQRSSSAAAQRASSLSPTARSLYQMHSDEQHQQHSKSAPRVTSASYSAGSVPYNHHMMQQQQHYMRHRSLPGNHAHILQQQQQSSQQCHQSHLHSNGGCRNLAEMAASEPWTKSSPLIGKLNS